MRLRIGDELGVSIGMEAGDLLEFQVGLGGRADLWVTLRDWEYFRRTFRVGIEFEK